MPIRDSRADINRSIDRDRIMQALPEGLSALSMPAIALMQDFVAASSW